MPELLTQHSCSLSKIVILLRKKKQVEETKDSKKESSQPARGSRNTLQRLELRA